MSAAPAGATPWNSEPRWAFAMFALGYFALGWLTLTPEHRWGDDWAQYVLHARNLVSGTPYPDTGYVFNPDYASVGPPSYAPGVPLLLAPVVALFGIDIVALKVVGLACITLVLPVALRVMAPATAPRVAMVGLVLFALHPAIWEQRQVIQSEAPYMLFSLLALAWGAHAPDAGAARHRAVLAGLLLGLLVYASTVSRSVGIALVPALLVYGWAKRRPLGWFAGFAIAFAGLLWLQTQWLVEPPTYQAELRAPTVARVSAKPWGYVVALAELFPLPLGLSPVAAIAFVLATAAGAWFAISRKPGDDVPARGLRARAARVPLFLWYFAAYLCALFLASVVSDPRLLIPLLPLAFPLAAFGVHEVGLRIRHGRAFALAAAVLLAGYLVALQATGRFIPVDAMATCGDCREMYAHVRAHTETDSVIVFSKPRALALFTGRRAWAAAMGYSPAQLDQRLERLGARYVIEAVPGTDFSLRYPIPPALKARIARPDALAVFRNDSFVVYRLGKPST